MGARGGGGCGFLRKLWVKYAIKTSARIRECEELMRRAGLGRGGWVGGSEEGEALVTRASRAITVRVGGGEVEGRLVLLFHPPASHFHCSWVFHLARWAVWNLPRACSG